MLDTGVDYTRSDFGSCSASGGWTQRPVMYRYQVTVRGEAPSAARAAPKKSGDR